MALDKTENVKISKGRIDELMSVIFNDGHDKNIHLLIELHRLYEERYGRLAERSLFNYAMSHRIIFPKNTTYKSKESLNIPMHYKMFGCVPTRYELYTFDFIPQTKEELQNIIESYRTHWMGENWRERPRHLQRIWLANLADWIDTNKYCCDGVRRYQEKCDIKLDIQQKLWKKVKEFGFTDDVTLVYESVVLNAEDSLAYDIPESLFWYERVYPEGITQAFFENAMLHGKADYRGTDEREEKIYDMVDRELLKDILSR